MKRETRLKAICGTPSRAASSKCIISRYFDVQTGRRRGVEALVRWRHPTRGLIPPDQFIPLAEETGLIVPLGEWIIRQACDDATSWPADTKVAVNLSPVQFKQAELFDIIESALRKSGIAAGAAGNRDHRIRPAGKSGRKSCLHGEDSRSIGVSLALDDFGTGYSSLSCLTAFPFDKIKIDKSFMGSLTKRHKSSAIISSIVTLARGLDMSVTAEGVETARAVRAAENAGREFRARLSARPPGADRRTRRSAAILSFAPGCGLAPLVYLHKIQHHLRATTSHLEGRNDAAR